mgnify:CR=1 FL=1
MIAFDVVFDRTIGSEGGYQADSRDRGNWTSGEVGKGVLKGTKFGVSAMTYPDLDIKALTVADAKAIYLRDWWQPMKMERMPRGMPFQLFDAAFNHGIGRANQMLQRAAGVKDDGQLGPVSLAAVQAMDHNDLLLRFLSQRLRYMAAIRIWDVYSRGWANRIADNMEFAAADN